jgi:glucose/mannose-6-phosphate isomerase
MSLDLIKTYETYDADEISYGVEHLGVQVHIAWEGTRDIKIPTAYKSVKNIVIVGMGGSALGPHLLVTAMQDDLKVPVQIVSDYHIPAYARRDSLIILSSFSGNTEEVLQAAKEARTRKLKTVIIATGGKLQAYAKRHKVPHYIFDPSDLAKEPRLGTIFNFIGIAGLLERVGLLRIHKKRVYEMAAAMEEVVASCMLNVETEKNPAKTVATELVGRSLMIVGAEHTAGAAHIFQNQIHETAKQWAVYHLLPELNHHLLEGLTFPKEVFKEYTVIMLRSKLYNKQIRKRFDITAEILEEQGAHVIDYHAGGGSRLEECGEVVQFSTFVSYYLGMLNKVNPRETPFVAMLKKKLK